MGERRGRPLLFGTVFHKSLLAEWKKRRRRSSCFAVYAHRAGSRPPTENRSIEPNRSGLARAQTRAPRRRISFRLPHNNSNNNNNNATTMRCHSSADRARFIQPNACPARDLVRRRLYSVQLVADTILLYLVIPVYTSSRLFDLFFPYIIKLSSSSSYTTFGVNYFFFPIIVRRDRSADFTGKTVNFRRPIRVATSCVARTRTRGYNTYLYAYAVKVGCNSRLKSITYFHHLVACPLPYPHYPPPPPPDRCRKFMYIIQ